MKVLAGGIPGTELRRVASLPDRLEGGVRVGPFSSACPGRLLRVVPGVGRFLARDGRSLEYWVEPQADPAAVEALLEGSVLGALIHQRGELPLHASTLVEPKGRFAVAIAGHSGAGKSTTAYALIRRGWTMLTDDLTRLTFTDRAPTAWPGRSWLRLMGDACARFGLDARTLAPVPNWPGKYRLDLPSWPQPVPLAAAITLERSAQPLEIDILRGAAALGSLIEQTFRIHYVEALGRSRAHLACVAAVASSATVLRKRGNAPVEDVARAIAAAVEAG